MDYFELECAVEQWAKDKGILDNGTSVKQAIKTLEECVELMEAVVTDDPEAVKDAIGDIVVTLIIQCKLRGVTLEQCIEHAYSQIRDRQGKMVNGMFIKETTGATKTGENQTVTNSNQ
jgi:NTP pyrophosphatase (non-canonical NTP hydrolase)